jgi:uncharacterized protein (DUF362 family)
MVQNDPKVFLAKLDRPAYEPLEGQVFPELPPDTEVTSPLAGIRRLFCQAGYDHERFGSAEWNPLGDFISTDSRVVIKPNWVMDVNLGGSGVECLVTHTSVLKAILEYVALAHPAKVVLGDAPVQGCDFENLSRAVGLEGVRKRFQNRIKDFSIKDFRRTKLQGLQPGAPVDRDLQPLSDYVRFNLGAGSNLEPITSGKGDFRVTMYNPDLLQQTHSAGRHEYLVARDFMEADVVINVPKLKTHNKAGITGALKNMVGMNGNKEFLPHHRKGGSFDGGDNYEGHSPWKSFAEAMHDRSNRSLNRAKRYLLTRLAVVGVKLNVALGGDRICDGSWRGNDTVWRMVLDLQRILAYGTANGDLSSFPQRQVLAITDAIIAGEGEGPLYPSPVPLGMLSLGTNNLAVEYVHSLLMHLEADRIPVIREAFLQRDYMLARFSRNDIRVFFEGEERSLADVPSLGVPFAPPEGWRGHCELAEEANLLAGQGTFPVSTPLSSPCA